MAPYTSPIGHAPSQKNGHITSLLMPALTYLHKSSQSPAPYSQNLYIPIITASFHRDPYTSPFLPWPTHHQWPYRQRWGHRGLCLDQFVYSSLPQCPPPFPSLRTQMLEPCTIRRPQLPHFGLSVSPKNFLLQINAFLSWALNFFRSGNIPRQATTRSDLYAEMSL